MQCPSCGYQEMEIRVVDETVSHNGTSIILLGMKGHFCPRCNEGVWDERSYIRYVRTQDKLIKEERDRKNNGRVLL